MLGMYTTLLPPLLPLLPPAAAAAAASAAAMAFAALRGEVSSMAASKAEVASCC
jgi:hypothetical protein